MRSREVTISIGIGAIGAPNDTAAAMLKRADLALYRAKRDGRNRVVGARCLGPDYRPAFFTELDQGHDARRHEFGVLDQRRLLALVAGYGVEGILRRRRR